MNKKRNSFSLTAVIIQDQQHRGFTAYFAEFPEIIADGATESEAKENLMEALHVLLLVKKDEAELQSGAQTFNDQKITTENFEFELA